MEFIVVVVVAGGESGVLHVEQRGRCEDGAPRRRPHRGAVSAGGDRGGREGDLKKIKA